MKESEYAENNVKAKVIISKVLEGLQMNAPSFSQATGISYQRVYDLQSGRTKKFNPGVVNLIVDAFPQVRKEFLYTGEGPVFVDNIPPDLIPDFSPRGGADGSKALERAMEMQASLMERAERLSEREAELHKREIELLEREHDLELRIAKLGGAAELDKKAAV